VTGNALGVEQRFTFGDRSLTGAKSSASFGFDADVPWDNIGFTDRLDLSNTEF